MTIDAELVSDAAPTAVIDIPEDDIGRDLQSDRPAGRWRLVAAGALKWIVVRPFQTASLIVLLAVLAAIPVFQLVALGYLLEVSGRVARSGRLRDGLFLLDQAGRIGTAIVAILVMSLPIRAVATWAEAARLVDPAGNAAAVLQVVGTLLVVAIAAFTAGMAILSGTRPSYAEPGGVHAIEH